MAGTLTRPPQEGQGSRRLLGMRFHPQTGHELAVPEQWRPMRPIHGREARTSGPSTVAAVCSPVSGFWESLQSSRGDGF